MTSDSRDINPHSNTDPRPQFTAAVQTPRADGILVLGMHRSGTSAVAGVLRLMGAFLGEPDELLPTHVSDNPTGYWERDDIVAAHDAILEANGYKWDRIAGFDPLQLRTDSITALQKDLRTAIVDLTRPDRPWLIKDPRMCLLLPHWLSLVENPACIVVVRDPSEISESMRDGPRGTYTSHYLIALWEKYLRSALTALRGKTALFVNYTALLEKPEAQCERLLRGLTSLGVNGLHLPQPADLSAFLDPQLRRSQPKSHVQLQASQKDLSNWLQAKCAAANPELVNDVPDGGTADEILIEFERALAVQTQRALVVHAERELAAQADRSLVTQANNDRDEMRSQRDAAQQACEVATSQLAEAHRQIEEKIERIRELSVQAEQSLRKNSIFAMQLAQVTHQRNVAAGDLDHTRHERNVAASGRNEVERHARALENSIQDLHASWSWNLTFPLRAIGELFSLRFSARIEQGLYRFYYALPGISLVRKRKFVLWLHSHTGWLTHNTLSYRLAQQARDLQAQQAQLREVSAQSERMDAQRAESIVKAMQNPPLLSIVMPVYNVEARWLEAAVSSVRQQFYPHWELCVADDASTRADTRAVLDALSKDPDKRIKLVRLKQNAGIARASNAALKLATGDYVGLLDNDDELTRDALLEMARRIVADKSDVLYSDEDKLDENGRHVEPHFKPDYNEEYFFSINYVCHFSVIRRKLIERIGGFHPGFDGAQDYDLLLRATEYTRKVSHVPLVLYHWRRIPGSTAADSAAKPHTSDAGRRALAESLARRRIKARVEKGPFPNTFHVRRAIHGEPLVSILVPFRDKPELLDGCVRSILAKTRYRNFELIGIDNNSVDAQTHTLKRDLQKRDARVRFITYPDAFNYSAINNFGARHARGEHLLFLNNDTEVIAPDWLGSMLEHSQRLEVGVVGAKLLYADNTLQHAGVIVGLGGVAGHSHLLLPQDDPGYFARAQLTQSLSAVTFACAMTRRAIFEQLGGLDEQNLCIAFNDIDYCLRAREAGFLVVYTPNAMLHHYESKSRGYEDTPEKQRRFGEEIRHMQRRHATALQRGDPYYNPNLSLTHAYAVAADYVGSLPQ